MNDWTIHPDLNQIDPLKQKLIQAAATQVQGKSGTQMATVMMALITSAQKHHVHFSPEEMSLILEVLKDGKSPDEKNQIDNMVAMVMNLMKENRLS